MKAHTLLIASCVALAVIGSAVVIHTVPNPSTALSNPSNYHDSNSKPDITFVLCSDWSSHNPPFTSLTLCVNDAGKRVPATVANTTPDKTVSDCVNSYFVHVVGVPESHETVEVLCGQIKLTLTQSQFNHQYAN